MVTTHPGRLCDACQDRHPEVGGDHDHSAPHLNEGTPRTATRHLRRINHGRDDARDLAVGAVRELASVSVADETFGIRLEDAEFVLLCPDAIQLDQ